MFVRRFGLCRINPAASRVRLCRAVSLRAQPLSTASSGGDSKGPALQNAGAVWTADADAELLTRYNSGKVSMKQLAEYFGRSPFAIEKRLEKLTAAPSAAATEAPAAPYTPQSYDFSKKVVCHKLSPPVDTSRAAFVAPSAEVMGDVQLAADSTVFYGSILRADINSIVIGARTNVQDGTVIHVTDQLPVTVGSGVTIGHRAMLHGCTIANDVLVGMGAIVMDGVSIGADSLVAAGAVCTPHKSFPAGSLIIGSPAKRLRATTNAEKDLIRWSAAKYVQTGKEHAAFNKSKSKPKKP